MGDRNWTSQHEPRFASICKNLDTVSNGDTILDVGVEPYQLSEYLSKRLPSDIEYIGIAYGENGNEWTKDVDGIEIPVRACNVEESWPVRDDSVDYVVMGAILEHLFDPLTALEEARRVATSDGTLVLSTPNAVRLIQRIRILFGRNIWDGFSENPYHRHNHEWTTEELHDILRAAGWEVTGHNYVTLQRTGLLGSLFEIATGLRSEWDDQHVICASVCEPEGTPMTYRDSLVSREN